MPATFDENGLVIQTTAEILAEIQDEYRSRISTSIDTSLTSFVGQEQRIIARSDQLCQEKIQQLYQSLDARVAEGAHLDIRIASTLGLTRLAAQSAEVLGTATGTPTTVIPDGTIVSVGGFEFATVDGPYTIGGGGTISSVRVRSTLMQPIDVATLGAWSIVTAVSGFDSFDDDSQPILGRRLETDTEFRERAEIERFKRASGPLAAIDANVLAVEGVTYAKAWHNVDPAAVPTDSDGIPLYAINVVVAGGDGTAVAEAIERSGPAGTVFFGSDVTVTLGTGVFLRDVSFDRPDDVEIWIDVTYTTSTSEVAGLPAAELLAATEAALLTFTDTTWIIGKDVLPVELVGALSTAGIPGLDAISVLVSLDDGATDPYSAAKRPITIRQQARFSTARLTVTEV